MPLFAAGAQVRYLANEGFLLQGGGRKVLVDALFGRGLDGYAALDPAVRQALESAQAPFDDVDLILATHFHGDHFDATAVAAHLRSNPGAHFVSTPQAVELLGRELNDEPAVRARVEAVHPPEGLPRRLSRQGVGFEVFNLHHGRNRRPPVENLGFLIQLGELRILHIGDTEADSADFEPYELPAREIDLALLPAWYLTYDHWIAAVRQQIRPRRIGVMHLALPTAPASYFGPDGSYNSRIAEIRENFPQALIFEQPTRVDF